MKKITLLLAMLIGSFAVSAQDTCAGAVSVTEGINTVGAIDGSDVPTPLCADGNGPVPSNPAGEWYTYSSTTDIVASITTNLTQNSGGDTRIHVYSGSCGSLVCEAGNDDISAENFLSEVSWLAEAGVTYYIAWDNRWSDAGFDFEFTTSAVPNAPDAAISPDPADGSTVFLSEGTNQAGDPVQQYQFTWELPDGSEDATTYTFDLGTDANVDLFTTDVNGNGLLLSGLQLSSTYFWRVTSNNPGGSTVGAVWSFTTESTLSNGNFEMKKVLEHYYSDNKLILESDEVISNVTIYNMLGQEMMNTKLSNNNESINVSSFSNGMYITKVTIGDKTETFKFIKK
ncbi:T9SS type A sorting domain-containing protein [Psychroflexus aestuariivivens]|uniref:T9SS type A sorting domain-containing protein n=1 Tax=Psychroflexus aestuariivivens TaxID=1795040 RepID=UPI000FDC4C5F|nr:T9SS type A sorting domain-containing protein [Psychroflexus aestuariivivens]